METTSSQAFLLRQETPRQGDKNRCKSTKVSSPAVAFLGAIERPATKYTSNKSPVKHELKRFEARAKARTSFERVSHADCAQCGAARSPTYYEMSMVLKNTLRLCRVGGHDLTTYNHHKHAFPDLRQVRDLPKVESVRDRLPM